MKMGLGFGFYGKGSASPPPLPFAPTDITGLSAWYDASDITSLTQVAGAVSQWSDKSGNNRNAVQPTGASQPVTGTRTVNGLNVLDFDGTGDTLTLSGDLRNLALGDGTVLLVYATDNAAKGQRLFVISNGATPSIRLTHSNGSLDTTYGLTASVARTADTAAHMAGFVRNGGSLLTIHDGVSASVSGVANVSVTHGPYLGREYNNANQLDGVLAEVLIYGRALSNAEVNAIGAYFAAKWGISWTNL